MLYLIIFSSMIEEKSVICDFLFYYILFIAFCKVLITVILFEDRFRLMTNFILQYGRKSMPVIYVLAQALLLVGLNEAQQLHYSHLILAIASVVAYLSTAYSNPGFLINQIVENAPPPISSSEPVIPIPEMSPRQISRVLTDQFPIHELGIESCIEKQSQFKPDSNHEDPIIESQFGDPNMLSQPALQAEIQLKKQLVTKKTQDEVQKKSHLAVPNVRKFQRVKNYEDHVKQSILQAKQSRIIVHQDAGFAILPEKLRNVSRWCKLCKQCQPLRVRHCLECRKCVSNFDHHCPWMNNCIGEKNKLLLVFYTLVQDIQLIYLFFSIEQFLSGNTYQNELLLLWLVIFLLALMVSGMLAFQMFLIVQNITTWEYVRWSKIEYLKIFNQKTLKSLFDKGLKSNVSIFFRANCSKEKINWISQICPEAHDHLIQEGCVSQR